MEGIGAEISQKIKSAIKAKLTEIGVYVDEELPDYVMVMVANKRTKVQMDDELKLFLGRHTSLFTTWLHQVLQKLQEISVANKGAKKSLPEATKKKKKSKTDLDKRVLKKKVKSEEDNDNVEELQKVKQKEKVRKGSSDETETNISIQNAENTDSMEKDKAESTKTTNEEEIMKHTKKYSNSTDTNRKSQDEHSGGRPKHLSTSSHIDDIDDEDYINIRTDGELLDTAEEINFGDDVLKKDKENENLNSSKKALTNKKRRLSCQESSVNPKVKSKSEISDSSDRCNRKVSTKRDATPPRSLSNDDVLDARELLNRKKAAKQSESRAGSHSRNRSKSPQSKGKTDYHEDRDSNKKSTRENEKEMSNHRKSSRENERDRRSKMDREVYSTKRRVEDRPSQRNMSHSDSRDRKRRDSSVEPPNKRVMVERSFRNKNNDHLSKNTKMSDSRKRTNMPPEMKMETEEPRKRTGLTSRVVARNPQPEEDVETPVPSVVRVTPRPRRPPSQQPSSNLIMKAISEANKSMANVPPRPDSTQRSRKEPILTRTLRNDRIPPEKIAVSITNPLALQNAGSKKHTEKNIEIDENPSILEEDGTNSEESTLNNQHEVTSSEPANSTPGKDNLKEDKAEKMSEDEESPLDQDMHGPILQLEADEEIVENYNDPMEVSSDPQFVVTLNGYDPDGLYSHSELDLGEDGECDEWLRQQVDDEAPLTSTPNQMESPRPNSSGQSATSFILGTAAVNHNNLIEVEIMKSKTTERCKYWPACKLADKCTYYHPTKPCKMFPTCKFGDTCLYIHPQCKYNALCTRKDCVFAHSPAHTPSQPAAISKPKALYASSAVMTCKFYPNCTNMNCQFVHPSRACRYGLYCTKKDCSFDHGKVAPVDKLKWTRVPSAT